MAKLRVRAAALLTLLAPRGALCLEESDVGQDVCADGACTEEQALHLVQRRARKRAGDATEPKNVTYSPFGERGTWSFLQPDPNILRWDHAYSSKKLPPAGPIGGWLSVPMVHDEYFKAALNDVNIRSPRLCLRITAIPAFKQPAVSGPILFHCGGPGSGRNCVKEFGSPDNRVHAMFDRFSIDQRGISLYAGDPGEKDVPKCPFKEEGSAIMPPVFACDDLPKDAEKMIELLDVYGQQAEILRQWETMTSYDKLFNRTVVEMKFRLEKLHAALCYQAPRFQIPLEGSTGKSGSLNFFDYVSTSQLVRDLDLLRQAVGAPKLSIHGFSYGTLVASLYATYFPDKSERIIVNGVVPPDATKRAMVSGSANAFDTVWSGIAEACDQSAWVPGGNASDRCPPAPHASKRFLSILNQSKSAGLESLILVMAQLVVQDPYGAAALFAACLGGTEKGQSPDEAPWDLNGCSEMIMLINLRSVISKLGDSGPPKDEPVDALGFTPQAAILALDLEGSWTPEVYMREWDAQVKYGFPMGMITWAGWANQLFTWPATARPTPPLSSGQVPLLVVGNLFDGQTNYKWAQQMRRNFEKGSLLTWQGFGHCFAYEKYTAVTPQEAQNNLQVGDFSPAAAMLLCERLISAFLITGELPPDGHACLVPKKLELGPSAKDEAFEKKLMGLRRFVLHKGIAAEAVCKGMGYNVTGEACQLMKTIFSNETDPISLKDVNVSLLAK